MMIDIPGDLKLDIIRRVGRSGFTLLAPFITAGKETKDLVFTPEVLKEVALDEFMVFGQMALEDSIYRSFLMKCVEHGNIEAKYIEGVRVLRQEGDSHGFQLLLEAADEIINAKVALGLFLICAGHFEDGMVTLIEMWNIVPSVNRAVEIAEFVVAQIASMNIQPPAGLYEDTLDFPWVPWCVYLTCNEQDVCKHCFAYWYSRLVCSLC